MEYRTKQWNWKRGRENWIVWRAAQLECLIIPLPSLSYIDFPPLYIKKTTWSHPSTFISTCVYLLLAGRTSQYNRREPARRSLVLRSSIRTQSGHLGTILWVWWKKTKEASRAIIINSSPLMYIQPLVMFFFFLPVGRTSSIYEEAFSLFSFLSNLFFKKTLLSLKDVFKCWASTHTFSSSGSWKRSSRTADDESIGLH